MTLFLNDEKDSLVQELISADAEVKVSQAIFALCFSYKKKTSFFSLFRVLLLLLARLINRQDVVFDE